MAGRYINLFTDFDFKKLFGTEENKDLILDFLNTFLPDKQNVTELQYLNNQRLGNAMLTAQNIKKDIKPDVIDAVTGLSIKTIEKL